MAETHKYSDVASRRRARNGAEADAQREIFVEAYDIAMQIVALRQDHGLTQAQLAELSGIDQGDLSRIERGATNPTARTLGRIAKALDADVRLVARSS